MLALCIVSCSPKQQAEPPLTAEGKAYIRYLPLTDVGMKATESYAKQVLTEIAGAMERINDGTFGHCEECQSAIPRARLQALPYTRFCVDCARKLEKSS